MPTPKFAGLMFISRLLGVVPEFGATESQVSPAGLVAAVAENGMAAPSVLVTETVYTGSGATVPAIAVALIED